MGLLWLVILAIAMSAVSLYYYLRVLKRVYVAAPATGSGEMRSPILSQILMLLLAASVLLLGCAPQLLLRWILAAIRVSGL
jgi:NADH-quinone oxidoreductase subunit N